MPKHNLIKFLPSYVGSKACWVDKLEKYKGRNFVESFCGSGVLSANLAKNAILNDSDTFVYKILSRFDEQIIQESFGEKEYFEARSKENWWQYAYSLQKLSFSGVFRYSKNGYNVPIKHKNNVYLKDDYKISLKRWNELNPIITNLDYQEINHLINKNDVLILDPPYESAQASYNTKSSKNQFDHQIYWEYVRLNENICKTIILFEFTDNLFMQANDVRKTRVNGARAGNEEGCFIFEDSLREGQKGEELFLKLMEGKVIKLDGLRGDFIFKNGEKLELKSDYHSMRTENYFIERFSYDTQNGGPWQALDHNCKYFAYFYPKDKVCFFFNTEKLVNLLDNVIKKLKPIPIRNKNHTTWGYKINRELLKDLVIKEIHFK